MVQPPDLLFAILPVESDYPRVLIAKTCEWTGELNGGSEPPYLRRYAYECVLPYSLVCGRALHSVPLLGGSCNSQRTSAPVGGTFSTALPRARCAYK